MRSPLRILTGLALAATLWLPTATHAASVIETTREGNSSFSSYSGTLSQGARIVNQVTATVTPDPREEEGTSVPATPTTEVSSDETDTTATLAATATDAAKTETVSPTTTAVATETSVASATASTTATRTTTSLVPSNVATSVPTNGTTLAPTEQRPTTLPNTGEPGEMLLWLVVAAVFSFIFGTSLLALQHRIVRGSK